MNKLVLDSVETAVAVVAATAAAAAAAAAAAGDNALVIAADAAQFPMATPVLASLMK